MFNLMDLIGPAVAQYLQTQGAGSAQSPQFMPEQPAPAYSPMGMPQAMQFQPQQGTLMDPTLAAQQAILGRQPTAYQPLVTPESYQNFYKPAVANAPVYQDWRIMRDQWEAEAKAKAEAEAVAAAANRGSSMDWDTRFRSVDDFDSGAPVYGPGGELISRGFAYSNSGGSGGGTGGIAETYGGGITDMSGNSVGYSGVY